MKLLRLGNAVKLKLSSVPARPLLDKTMRVMEVRLSQIMPVQLQGFGLSEILHDVRLEDSDKESFHLTSSCASSNVAADIKVISQN